MKKIINKENNTVNYGIYDEKIDFNWQDYVLHSFFDKKVSPFKKKFGFHKFHFISFSNEKYIVGLAFVDISIARNIFGYVYQKDKGVICDWQKDIMGKAMKFTSNIDYSEISYHAHGIEVDIKKNIDDGKLIGHLKFKEIIDVNYEVALSLMNKPLRVLNPADFDHWVFTAKRAGLKTNHFEIKINGEKIDMDHTNTLASIDWSGGYFRKDTSWVWGCASTKVKKDIVGFNFAVFNNNALYPENAVWVNDEREHIEHILFKWNYTDPYKDGMEIYTTDDRVHLWFKPLGQKDDVHSRGFGMIKTNFRQFFGEYTGHVSCNGKKIKLEKFLGLFEIHKAIW